jgi:RNA polymerase sigma-70 factor (ECF subfamily)
VVGVFALAGTVGVAATPSLRERIAPSARHHAIARPTEVVRTAPRAPAAESLPSAPRESPALEREVRLLRGAQQSMRDGRPERALALLAEHDRQFPAGLLRQEGLAARVMALCALGRTAEARRDAAEFLNRWPASPLSAQVRASCGHEPSR